MPKVNQLDELSSIDGSRNKVDRLKIDQLNAVGNYLAPACNSLRYYTR